MQRAPSSRARRHRPDTLDRHADAPVRDNTVYFDFAKWSLRPETANTLDTLAAILKREPSLRVIITGYTDAIGTDATRVMLRYGFADRGLHRVQLEVLATEGAYTARGRPRAPVVYGSGLLPDFRRWGGYLLAGYRLPWIGLMPLLDFQFGCASNAEAIVPSPYNFTYFQAGGFDCSLLSFLQIDRDGCVNVSKLGVRPNVTAGAGGFVVITARAWKIVFA